MTGSVPIPVCALKLTEKLAETAIRSETSADVTLSIASPPYSSGTSTDMRPSLPASRSNSRVTGKFFASISAMRGRMDFSANSAVVRAISCCSSEKSSGVKTSSGTAFKSRKLPPTAGLGAATVAIVEPLSNHPTPIGMTRCDQEIFRPAALASFAWRWSKVQKRSAFSSRAQAT